MAIGNAISLNSRKRKPGFISKIGKAVKSSLCFGINPKKEANKTEEHSDENLNAKIAFQNCQLFSFETLDLATQNFHPQTLLGQGGSGGVYKGILTDGTEIAVKKLFELSSLRRKEFQNEAELLSRVNHPNVVKLRGYCDVQSLLVYEFVKNNDLNKLLFHRSEGDRFEWADRFKIIQGIARAVRHLQCDHELIHRDIKSSNILIDQKGNPKLADFGLGRLLPQDQTSDYTTNRPGTWGYKAPEYCLSGKLSKRTDIYSFGVTLLEIVTGRRCLSLHDNKDLLVWAYELFKDGRISEIVDPELICSPDLLRRQVFNCIKVALLCVQYNPRLRPRMDEVVMMLAGQNQSPVQMEIGIPGTYLFQDGGETSKANGHQSQNSHSNLLYKIMEEDQSIDSFTSYAHDHNATKDEGIKLEAQVVASDVSQSQHSSSSAFPAQDEGVGRNMATESNESLKLSPGTSSFEAIVDQPLEKLQLPEMKISGSQDQSGGLQEQPQINGKPNKKKREVQLLMEQKMKMQKELEEVSDKEKREVQDLMERKMKMEKERVELKRKWEELTKKLRNDDNVTYSDFFHEGALYEDLVELNTGIHSCQLLMEKHEQEKIRKSAELRRAISAIEVTLKGDGDKHELSSKLPDLKRRIQIEVENFDWPTGSWYPESWKQSPLDDLLYIGNAMDKLKEEMSSNYGRLKALDLEHKFEKDKLCLPWFVTSLSESDEMGKAKFELDKENVYTEAKKFFTERLADLDEGIKCVDGYVKAREKWNKGLQIMNIEELHGATAMAQPQGTQKSWSQQISAQQTLGDHRPLSW